MLSLELLAPARDAATAMAAISHGADAVYIGAPEFGARSAAGNSIQDISRVVEEAHKFGARVYVTLNTIVYDSEIKRVEKMVDDLWCAGVDALIVQDMALLEMRLPPIDLHASTQTDARSVKKIKWLADAGFSQIVLPREYSIEQIREAARAVPDASLEVFVHGALCVSFSGDCHAGVMLVGRSANRGECPQLCRLEYTLTDRNGRPVDVPDGGSPTRHWLSLADMNRLEYLAELIEAGATSFKIEGRLKSTEYVKNVTLAYSRELDRIVAESNGRYRRSSFGQIDVTFTPDVTRSFNRGFTPYFIKEQFSKGITSWNTPKWVGRPVATLLEVQGSRLRIKSRENIANGDGLGYFDEYGRFKGFRINRAEGQWIYPSPGAELPKKVPVQLYRNADTAWDAHLRRDDTARRSISVEFTLRILPDGRMAIDAVDERGCCVTVASSDTYTDRSRTPQEAHRRQLLERTGDTIYRVTAVHDLCGDVFLPSKALAALRRDAVSALDSEWRIRYRRKLRRRSKLSPDALADVVATYHDNVANSLARRFYENHGAKVDAVAAEVEKPRGTARIMTTRYCLRRELGACLKGKSAVRLPDELFLEAPIGRLRLGFDCKNCNMTLTTIQK